MKVSLLELLHLVHTNMYGTNIAQNFFSSRTFLSLSNEPLGEKTMEWKKWHSCCLKDFEAQAGRVK